ncbi:hypothetical protein GCM10027614_13310 [Micromonospora vulcania]
MRTLSTVVGYRLLGGAGAALLAGAGLAAGALPVGAHTAWWTALRQLAGPGLLCGYAGLTLLAVAWWWAGRHLRPAPPAVETQVGHPVPAPRVAAADVGHPVSALRVAAAQVGHPVSTPVGDPRVWRSAALTLACWAAPLLVGPPLFSRDAYSYLAQGAMVLADIDVYRHGVAQLGGDWPPRCRRCGRPPRRTGRCSSRWRRWSPR